MLRKKTFRLTLLAQLALLLSCVKVERNIPFDLVETGYQAPVRVIEAFDDSIIIAGGTEQGEGFIAVTNNELSSFNNIHNLKRAVYCTVRFSDNWFFGLAQSRLYFGSSLAQLTEYNWQQSDWVGDEFKHPFRRFHVDGAHLLATTGGKLAFGVVYHTDTNFRVWNPLQVEHELRACASALEANEWTGWAGGNGIFLKKSSVESEWVEEKGFEGNFITALHFFNPSNGVAVTHNGAAYQTTNEDHNWNKVLKAKSGFAFNDFTSKNDEMIFCGNEGLFAYSKNKGEVWKWFELHEPFDLMACHIGDNKLVFGTSTGALAVISINSLR